jgi:hypothetical protein
VARGRARGRTGLQRKARRLPRRVRVDEKAVVTGHVYLTLVCDLEAATIE